MGRKAWILTLVAMAVAVLVVAAWIEGGPQPRRLIEQPVDRAAERE